MQTFNFQRQKIERIQTTQGRGSTQFQVSYKTKTLVVLDLPAVKVEISVFLRISLLKWIFFILSTLVAGNSRTAGSPEMKKFMYLLGEAKNEMQKNISSNFKKKLARHTLEHPEHKSKEFGFPTFSHKVAS